MLRTWTSHTLLNGTKSQRTPKEIAKLLVDTWVRPLEMSWMYVFPFDFSRWFCSHVSWHWCGTLLETKIKSVWRDAMICIFFQPGNRWVSGISGATPPENLTTGNDINPVSPWSTPFLRGVCQSEQSFYHRIHRLSNVHFTPGCLFDIGDDKLPNYMGIIS